MDHDTELNMKIDLQFVWKEEVDVQFLTSLKLLDKFTHFEFNFIRFEAKNFNIYYEIHVILPIFPFVG